MGRRKRHYAHNVFAIRFRLGCDVVENGRGMAITFGSNQILGRTVCGWILTPANGLAIWAVNFTR